MDFMAGKHVFAAPERVGLVSSERFCIPIARLMHTCVTDGKIGRATLLSGRLLEDSVALFQKKTGAQFDKFDAEHAKIMRPLMWEDGRMKEIFNVLGLDYGKVEKLYLPWWALEGGREISCKMTGNGAAVELGSRHSYQTQLRRNGEDIEGMNAVSVAGMVLTSDDKLVVGLRGGFNFPNTYYFNAGALQMTDALKSGRAGIFETYARTELLAEYGMQGGKAHDAILLSRVECFGADRDVSYVFLIKTPATFEEVRKTHAANPNKDKHEHRALAAVEATKEAVVAFVERFYKGAAANDLGRRYEDRVLLPQGAAPLLDYVGSDLSKMDVLAQG